MGRSDSSVDSFAATLMSGTGELTQDGGVVCIPLVHRGADISLQAAGVVTQPAVRTRPNAEHATDGPKVDRHVGKGPGHDVAAAYAGGELDVAASDAGRRRNDRPVVWDILAITAETVLAAVKDGGVLGCRGVLGPVPVLEESC